MNGDSQGLLAGRGPFPGSPSGAGAWGMQPSHGAGPDGGSEGGDSQRGSRRFPPSGSGGSLGRWSYNGEFMPPDAAMRGGDDADDATMPAQARRKERSPLTAPAPAAEQQGMGSFHSVTAAAAQQQRRGDAGGFIISGDGEVGGESGYNNAANGGGSGSSSRVGAAAGSSSWW